VEPWLKRVFYVTFSVLYLSGLVEYVLKWLSNDPTPAKSLVLHIHGIVGLGFLYLFGHFYNAHIRPSLRQMRHRKSGISVWILLSILSISVPFLYYLSDEQWRNWTVVIHTYLGLIVAVPLATHIYLAICRR
jgi:hypothetical protein